MIETIPSQEEKQDKWQITLEEELCKLQGCQQSKQLNSCYPCKEILQCETRSVYIRAVYESMNKGTGGGFEF